jgi:succinoglycan biosynthesis protein ExoM
LRNCLLAIAKLQIPDKYHVKIIVVDNDENETARVIHSELQKKINLPTYYFVEKTRGLSTVRNRLIEESILLKADLIAFIDDDEQPALDWLCQLTLAMEKHNADVCTGPAIEINTENPSTHKKTLATGSKPRHISTNNVLLKTKLIVEQNLRFDIFYNFIGAEDFDFFERSSKLCNTHIWVAEAKVYEILIEQRDRLSYLYYRHFTGGINSIMRYRRSNPLWRAWLRYLPKIIGKLLSSILSILLCVLTFSKKHRNDAIKRFSNGTGYFAGLMNVAVERYKNIQAEDINTS